MELVDEDSWLAFNILKLDGKWLSEDPKNWCTSEEYRAIHDFVSSLKLTNDTAEGCATGAAVCPHHRKGGEGYAVAAAVCEGPQEKVHYIQKVNA